MSEDHLRKTGVRYGTNVLSADIVHLAICIKEGNHYKGSRLSCCQLQVCHKENHPGIEVGATIEEVRGPSLTYIS